MNYLPDKLLDEIKNSNLKNLIKHILCGIRKISNNLRNNNFKNNKIGTLNKFGDEQLEVDLNCDNIIFDCLKKSNCVYIGASEENPKEIYINKNLNEGFSVAFDPLDGSSIIDANFAVGTIIGIWEGEGIIGKNGNDLCVSLISQYGPKTTIALAISNKFIKNDKNIVIELTMTDNLWEITNNFKILENAKTFAPGNLRAVTDNNNYMNLINYFIKNRYTLRYTGGLVPDIYHILTKGQGIFTNVSSINAKAKLRLAFEVAPIAFIIESCGGITCQCPEIWDDKTIPISILDIRIDKIDQRIGIACGSIESVNLFKNFLFKKEKN